MLYLIFGNNFFLWKCFRRRNKLNLFLFNCYKLLFLLECLSAQKQQQNCFEKQYKNLIINFGSLHIIKRIGIVCLTNFLKIKKKFFLKVSAPDAFYLAHYIDEEIAGRRIKNYKIETGDDRNFLKMTNGEKHVRIFF